MFCFVSLFRFAPFSLLSSLLPSWGENTVSLDEVGGKSKVFFGVSDIRVQVDELDRINHSLDRR
jgi:hypothetical protein